MFNASCCFTDNASSAVTGQPAGVISELIACRFNHGVCSVQRAAALRLTYRAERLLYVDLLKYLQVDMRD